MKTLSQLLILCAIICYIPSCTYGLAVMSVDFGNEYMKIAIVKPGVPMEIVLNKESLRKTPTAITLKDGERLVGDPALNAAIRYPKSSYRYLLDVLGKHFDNPLVRLYQKRFPYHEMEKDPDTGMVLFKHEDGQHYSPEELIAMMLQKAKEYAETFAEQPLNEAVITVPSFFNQAERRAMLRAAELAGLRVLQLINDNTAVALNYGIFRQKMFNSTALHYMFFDIGASGTSATIVAYQIAKAKSAVSGLVDSHPQLTIKGIGFDRTLGGMEFQLRLRDFLADQFNQAKRTKKDVKDDVRAMAKLYKEAGRLKQVLSANADHFAQVESLLDDEDFRAKVTREQFEELCQDLVNRVDHVVQDALATAQLSMDNIEEVILMGGGTRIPKVQEAIKKATGREELGKGINTDEAAALGAVYQAAHLGKGFKVKKFAIKDATLYPISVEFERVKMKEDETTEVASKTVRRVLFGHMQPYPQKKVMTFNRQTKDFTFDVVYSDLKFLSEAELSEFGSTSLYTVALSGVEDAHNANSEDSESKGIKAHFHMHDSGILQLDKVEALFEKTVEVPVVEEESTLTKIGNTISNLFGGGSKSSDEEMKEGGEVEQVAEMDSASAATPEAGAVPPNDTKAGAADTEPGADSRQDDETSQSEQQQQDEEPTKNDKVEEQEADETADGEKKIEEKLEEKPDETTEPQVAEDGTTTKDAEAKKDEEKVAAVAADEKKVNVKVKTTTVRVEINAKTTIRDLPEPPEEHLKQARKLLAEMKKVEEERHLLAKVKNDIESFVFDTQDKLEQRNYRLCSTEEERVEISSKLAEASDWLLEQEDNTPRKDYEDKLKQLKTATRNVFERVHEMAERPAAVAALAQLVNHTEYFLVMMRNFTGDELPYTQVEYDVLDKMVNETKEWNKTMMLEQAKTPLTEKPKFTVEDVGLKMASLDRELKYLINKMKSFRPKKPKSAKDANATESATGNETKTTTGGKTKTKVPVADFTENVKADDLDKDILEPVVDEETDSTSRSDSGDDATTTTDRSSSNHEPDDEL